MCGRSKAETHKLRSSSIKYLPRELQVREVSSDFLNVLHCWASNAGTRCGDGWFSPISTSNPQSPQALSLRGEEEEGEGGLFLITSHERKRDDEDMVNNTINGWAFIINCSFYFPAFLPRSAFCFSGNSVAWSSKLCRMPKSSSLSFS